MFNKRESKRILTHCNFFPKNRKAQELSTTTIILLVLGVLILVVLVIGFSTKWSAFKNLISPTNVDNLVEDCNTACGLNSKFSFCSAERLLRVNEDKLETKTSCAVLTETSNFEKYNVEECSVIECDLKCEEIVIDSKTGRKDLSSGKYDVSELANDLEPGQKCIIN